MSSKKGVKRALDKSSASTTTTSDTSVGKPTKAKLSAEERAQRKLRKEKRELVGVMLCDLHHLELIVTADLQKKENLMKDLDATTAHPGELVELELENLIPILSRHGETSPLRLRFVSSFDNVSDWLPDPTEVVLSLEALKLVEGLHDLHNSENKEFLENHIEFTDINEVIRIILADSGLCDIFTAYYMTPPVGNVIEGFSFLCVLRGGNFID